MPRTKIEKPSSEQLKKLEIDSWSPWDCDPTEFDSIEVLLESPGAD